MFNNNITILRLPALSDDKNNEIVVTLDPDYFLANLLSMSAHHDTKCIPKTTIAEDNDRYLIQIARYARDKKNREYLITYQFILRNDEEHKLQDLPWDNLLYIERIEIIKETIFYR